MKKNKTDEELLEKEGFDIVCQSPFEIQSKDGGFGNFQVAHTFIDSLRYGIKYGKSKDEKKAKKARNLTELLNQNCITEANYITKMVKLFRK